MKANAYMRASPADPQYLPYPHKTVILEITMFFLLQQFSNISPFFWWPPIFSSSSLKERERYNCPNIMGPSQLPFFNHIFSYTSVQPTFHMDIRGDILGYSYCSISFILGYPDMGKLYQRIVMVEML